MTVEEKIQELECIQTLISDDGADALHALAAMLRLAVEQRDHAIKELYIVCRPEADIGKAKAFADAALLKAAEEAEK